MFANSLQWLLHLLADDNPSIVALTTKILARVLVINGSSYVEKFADRTGGFIIMRYRLKRWWNQTGLWITCFAILFGRDVAIIDFGRPFDLYNLLASFTPNDATNVVNPHILPVITAMLQNGLKSVTKDQDDPESPLAAKISRSSSMEVGSAHSRQRSVSLQAGHGSPSKFYVRVPFHNAHD